MLLCCASLSLSFINSLSLSLSLSLCLSTPPFLLHHLTLSSTTHPSPSSTYSKSLSPFSNPTYNATILPCRSVGVQGDARTYSYVVGISGTEENGQPDWIYLREQAKQIPKAVHSINRVVYVFGEKLPSGKLTSITPTRLTPDVIKTLQVADDIVNEVLYRYKLTVKLSQVPVILIPVDFGVDGKRGIVIRTFITNDFMTGLPCVPGVSGATGSGSGCYLPLEALKEMVDGIMKEVDGISRVCYDLTGKPPGTTEWE